MRGPTPRAFADIVGNDLIPLGGLGQRWGDPDVEALKFSVNAGLDLSDSLELYGFATYMDNTTKSDFFYRGPVLRPAQPIGLAARTTLQIDGDPTRRTAAPTGCPIRRRSPWSTTSSRPGPRSERLPGRRMRSSPSGFVLRNPIFTEFPGGYNPDFGADLTDMSFVLGLRGDSPTR